ncbi:MAG: hypothetical protein EAZ92_08300 [Candidatus Kapaibacterium sp.]|nr:MAG: hypothetical protein EAZ92_08300 [Candidatus Kapabacteria bacterium]
MCGFQAINTDKNVCATIDVYHVFFIPYDVLRRVRYISEAQIYASLGNTRANFTLGKDCSKFCIFTQTLSQPYNNHPQQSSL